MTPARACPTAALALLTRSPTLSTTSSPGTYPHFPSRSCSTAQQAMQRAQQAQEGQTQASPVIACLQGSGKRRGRRLVQPCCCVAHSSSWSSPAALQSTRAGRPQSAPGVPPSGRAAPCGGTALGAAGLQGAGGQEHMLAGWPVSRRRCRCRCRPALGGLHRPAGRSSRSGRPHLLKPGPATHPATRLCRRPSPLVAGPFEGGAPATPHVRPCERMHGERWARGVGTLPQGSRACRLLHTAPLAPWHRNAGASTLSAMKDLARLQACRRRSRPRCAAVPRLQTNGPALLALRSTSTAPEGCTRHLQCKA